MFKYLKNLNNDSHPTEIYTIRASATEEPFGEIKAGSIVSVAYGEIATLYTPSRPKYLALTSKDYSETAQIKCIRVSSGMVFEADIDPDTEASSFRLGDLCDAKEDSTNKGVYITIGGNSNFEIIDNSNIKNGKITVVAI